MSDPEIIEIKPPEPEPKPKRYLSKAEVRSGVKTSLATAKMDPQIAWEVLQDLQQKRLGGPWVQDPSDDANWARVNSLGQTLAMAWGDRNSKGVPSVVKGCLCTAAFETQEQPRESRIREFPSIGVAMMFLDRDLGRLGFMLVPDERDRE